MEKVPGFPRVSTARYADDSWPENAVEDGKWFIETDSAKGGHSSLTQYPVPVYFDLAYDGIDITLQREAKKNDELENDTTTGDELLREVMTDDPYVVLGFNVANVPVDVSNWGGMCFEYFSTIPLTVELDVSDSLNAVFGAKPYVVLPESEWQKCVRWSDFALPTEQIPSENLEGSVGEIAAKHLSAIRFVVQSHEDTEVTLKICTISTYYF